MSHHAVDRNRKRTGSCDQNGHQTPSRRGSPPPFSKGHVCPLTESKNLDSKVLPENLSRDRAWPAVPPSARLGPRWNVASRLANSSLQYFVWPAEAMVRLARTLRPQVTPASKIRLLKKIAAFRRSTRFYPPSRHAIVRDEGRGLCSPVCLALRPSVGRRHLRPLAPKSFAASYWSRLVPNAE